MKQKAIIKLPVTSPPDLSVQHQNKSLANLRKFITKAFDGKVVFSVERVAVKLSSELLRGYKSTTKRSWKTLMQR
ncbi:hypothetical protein OH492_19780 [Vibrio chagasii]|nr:hypothetical protein [Vibrio chagasii]